MLSGILGEQMSNDNGKSVSMSGADRVTEKIRLFVADDSLADMVEITLRLEGLEIDEGTDTQPGLIIADSSGYAQYRQDSSVNVTPRRLLLLVSDETDIPEGIEYLVVPSHGNDHDLDPELLVKKTTDLLSGRRPSAEDNPVTGLPGTATFETELRERINSGERFGIIFTDLNQFRSYNRAYSYSRGDEMLNAVAELLSRQLLENSHPQNFVAHLGSDDFALITSEKLAPVLAEKIVDSFDEMVAKFYDVGDLSRGSVICIDRRGRENEFPLVTIALAVIISSRRGLSHPAEAYDIAEELLGYLKSREVTESCCIVERAEGRQGDSIHSRN